MAQLNFLRLVVMMAMASSGTIKSQETPNHPSELVGKELFVNVDKGVRLQVIDWGGDGRPLILIPGLGGRARAFRDLAPDLVSKFHVWSITRRGFDPSSIPPSGYSAQRLGDDVVEVMDALKLSKAVLGGHSQGGEEISSVVTNHPERVSGLIYLDAGYWYALYDTARGALDLDIISTIESLEQLRDGPRNAKQLETAIESLPLLEANLKSKLKDLKSRPQNEPTGTGAPKAFQLIVAGEAKFISLRAPTLAIFAYPPDRGPEVNRNPELKKTLLEHDTAFVGAQIAAFRRQVPDAKIQILPNASHFVWRSNKNEVIRAIDDFAATLP